MVQVDLSKRVKLDFSAFRIENRREYELRIVNVKFVS